MVEKKCCAEVRSLANDVEKLEKQVGELTRILGCDPGPHGAGFRKLKHHECPDAAKRRMAGRDEYKDKPWMQSRHLTGVGEEHLGLIPELEKDGTLMQLVRSIECGTRTLIQMHLRCHKEVEALKGSCDREEARIPSSDPAGQSQEGDGSVARTN
ncbi:MAG: hypothetical protein MI919_41530 [Holophagales bacterium]|nr:hypothetical protein [Holophagales bacterium]